MSDVESDEDLQRAIALSLEESGQLLPNGNPAVVDLVSDDEDDDLDAPVTAKPIRAASKALEAKHDVSKFAAARDPHEAGTPRSTSPEKRSVNISTTSSVPAQNSSMQQSYVPSSGILGLNRKQMEEERLARLARFNSLNGAGRDGPKATDESKKRKATALSPETHDDRSVKAKVSPSLPVSEAIASSIASQRSSNVYSKGHHIGSRSLGSGIQYPNGTVKKTWAYGFPRDGDDIKIEEVLQKDDLELAVLSAFQIDSDWIISKLNEKTKVVWVLQAKSEAEKENWCDNAPRKYRFCFPSMDGIINCMHSKLQLLAHGSYLRVVVPSANLVPYDWGESGVMENVCFLIDLPRLPEGESTELTTQFGIELSYFLSALGIDQSIVVSLKKFDFSKTANIGFVHTIGGSHNMAWQRTGYCGLGKFVQELGSDTDEALEIDFLTASIGSLNEDFVKAMCLACQGDDGLTEYGWRTGKSTRGKGHGETKRKPSDDLLSRCRVYFPTEQTVSRSKGGTKSGRTICFQEKDYNLEQFPKYLMRDSISKRQGMLMHSKMIFIRGSKKAMAYVGSANLSESAWGKLVKDRTSKQPKLNCRNWECGVLLSASGSTMTRKPSESEAGGQSLGMEVFDGVVPVPMLTPGEPYGARKPWYFSQH
ncbi:phospholipase D/nuclease [Acephala macrosclerotiorum]|nr:phospholipase D/nuclease [Acephala macrosclerotiorum]